MQVLRLRCEQEHLVSTGTKEALVQRLLANSNSQSDSREQLSNPTIASLASQMAELQRQLAAV